MFHPLTVLVYGICLNTVFSALRNVQQVFSVVNSPNSRARHVLRALVPLSPEHGLMRAVLVNKASLPCAFDLHFPMAVPSSSLLYLRSHAILIQCNSQVCGVL